MTRQFWIAAVLLAGCARGDAKPPTTDTAHPWRKPGDTIDSILPMPEYLRRFREGLVETARLEGGEQSREALARRFLSLISAQDTAGFASLLVTRAEFAWLIFPDHIYAHPPYELDPGIFWNQLQAGSEEGLHHVLQRFGGHLLAFQSLRCRRDTTQVVGGTTAIWSPCSMRFRAGDSLITQRLFGSIVERNGVAKLVSFANDY